jgi:FkbM family methyltransferase
MTGSSRLREDRFERTVRRLSAATATESRLTSLLAKAMRATLVVIRTNVLGRSSVVAVAKFWCWAVLRRTVQPSVVIALPTGGTFIVPSWSQIGGYLIATGFTEVSEQMFVSRLVRPGDLLVDVGSNIGLYGVTAGFHGAQVVAFEPVERAWNQTATNLTANQIAYEVHPWALSDFDGVSAFAEDDVESHLDHEGAIQVEVRRLDGLSLPGAPVTVLKVDAEGHDLKVLKGCPNFLTDRRPVVLVEYWTYNSMEIKEFLSALGYRFFEYDWRSNNLIPVSSISGNLICIHSATEDRIACRIGADID